MFASYLDSSSTVTLPDLQKEKNVTKAVAQSNTELNDVSPLSQIPFIFLRIVGVICILGREALPPLPLSTLTLFRIYLVLGPKNRGLFEANEFLKDRS